MATGTRLDDKATRLGVAPIARAHLDHRGAVSDRRRRYGSLLTDYAVTDDPSDAEVALLPHFIERTSDADVDRYVRTASAHGLRTLVFSGHDLEPLMPRSSIILLHPGPTRGAQPHADVLAVPFFFTSRSSGAEGRPDAERPSVAFCGQGTTRVGARAFQAGRRTGRWLANRRGGTYASVPLRSPVALRAQALRALGRDPRVDDRFLVRNQYRGGAADEAQRIGTQREFDDNLRSATYALCVRGTGNFSARFYEALSFGRVPLFVDTACVLPFDDEIDWRRRTVWVDRDAVGSIATSLVSHHRRVRLDPSYHPAALRALWRERLTQDGFFRHLVPRIRRML